MPIYPLSAPPLIPATEKITLRRKQGSMQSPFAGNKVTVENFSEWTFSLTFAPQTPAAARAFEAWRNSLNGAVGTFTYSPYGSGRAVTGKTLASTVYAYSETIVVAGWSAGAGSGLAVGDYFSIANKLYQITSASGAASGSGQVTLGITPKVRTDIAAGTAVNFQTPTTVLRLILEDEAAGVSHDSDASYVDGLLAAEAL